MGKTSRYDNAVNSLATDLSLALHGKRKLSELDDKIKKGDIRTINDIAMFDELAYMIRSGKVEIHIINQEGK